MPKKTEFCSKWLLRLDNANRVCSRWLSKGKKASTFRCNVCNADDLSCANGGWTDIKKHFTRPKHIQCMKDVFGSVSLVTSGHSSSSIPNQTNDGNLCLISTDVNTTQRPFITIHNDQRALTHDEKVTRTECIWAMATSQLAFSYNSSQFLPEIFRYMFPDSSIATVYSLRPRKLSYVISHGTGYYFTNELIKDVRKAHGFSLLFDETTITGIRKQLDIFFRYWSETKNGICVRFYKSIILGHATANIISQSIIDSLKTDGIDIAKMLMLVRDNPNVNKAVKDILNKAVIDERKKSPCPLHFIHGSFRKGIKSTSWFIDESINDIWFWFSRSPARREDFVSVAISINESYSRFVNRFVETRWIEIGTVIERIVDQWNVITEYFLPYLPKFDKKIELNDKYIRIKNFINDKSTLVKFHFILFIYRTVFKKQLVWFQQEQPLVHLLYNECCSLLRNVLLSFVKEELIRDKESIQLLTVSFELQNNQKNNINIDVGETTRMCIKDLSPNEKVVFFEDVRKIYCNITKDLIKSLPISNDFLRHLQCFQPSMRKHETSRASIMYLARNLPHLLTSEEVDRVDAEWRVYEMADISDEWIKKSTNSSSNSTEYVPIDKYWYQVFSSVTSNGAPQYLVLIKLVKCLLSLSHGNSDVERGFSQNNKLVSNDRSLLIESSISGLRATNAGIKFYGDGKTHMVPTTSTLLSNVQEAYSRYAKDIEEQQKLINSIDVINGKRASNVQHEQLEEKENQLIKEQKTLQDELTKATKMLEEGSTRLATAMNNKEFNEIGIAEVLLTAANARLTVLKNQLIENSDNLNQLRRKQKK
ncbi:unnamed protein product [Rotaria sordida]|uniref:Uncharacterized protein n=1 Tax=Rotaria sordida TaxID=392033 RepID=A0A814Y7K0_9BILA|nr:unnamed protein product [Rotaria sordida]CAF1506016.1 unnamed protein product [Rotaria sordida]